MTETEIDEIIKLGKEAKETLKKFTEGLLKDNDRSLKIIRSITINENPPPLKLGDHIIKSLPFTIRVY
jgi:hypothetical protein